MNTQSIREHLSYKSQDHTFFQWFDSLGIRIDQGTGAIHVGLPHRFFADWFAKEKQQWFEQELCSLCGAVNVLYTLPDGNAPFIAGKHAETAKPQQPVNAAKLGKSTGSSRLDHAFAFVPGVDFSSFIVNKKNDFSLVAAKKTVMDPSCPAYTPFVVYGHTGSGKTHLLNAMANALWQYTPAVPFFFGKAEDFLGQDLGSAQRLTHKAFFLDDFHQIAENKLLQKKFITFFDRIQRQSMLLALGLDSHPTNIQGLDPKVKQRLKSGLLIELKKPDLAVRLKYILRCITKLGLALTKEEALKLVQQYTEFRSIDGVLNLIKAHHSLHKIESSTLSFILNGGTENKTLTPALIINQLAEYFAVTPEDITGKSRQKNITMARQLAIFFCRELLGLSLAQIGHFFGHRDHSSIVYTLNKIQSLQQSDKVMNNHVTKLKKMFSP